MIENQDIRPAQVIGPLGEPLTLADLTGMTPDAGMVESPSPEEIVELLGVKVTHTPPDAE